MDLGIEVLLELFSKNGLQNLFDHTNNLHSSNSKLIYSLKNEYINSIDAVISFLQGNNSSLARLICSGNFLPEASRFSTISENPESIDWSFGNMGLQDKAKHLATLYLEDISDYIIENIDENFGFSRYAERLARCANTFDELNKKINATPSYIDKITLKIVDQQINKTNPSLICFSVPFPGNLYSALRCGKYIKENYPTIKIAMGGGFPNTELRSIKDIRVFNYLDYITLDDGELPLELLITNIENQKFEEFKRTFCIENNEVVYKNNSLRNDYKQNLVGTPDYSDLPLNKYISVIEVTNPMHSLWSDGRWNKLTMAHGCYWGKCTFCDISLDYIKVYEPVHAKLLVDRMEALINQTDERGFHFVDEAAPPALMRELALEIIRRNLTVTWWTNIRFEKSFSKGLCELLKRSGCIAVSGGLEVASDRLLNLIKKGVTVKQVAQVTQNFTESGIMIHAYLMYGYPTQTIQETVDSLEMVRQLFENGVLHSGFWHQFAMTAHSPVGLNPEKFGIIPDKKEIFFANNDVSFKDKTGINHEKYNFGLKKSLFNYMQGIGLDYSLQEWFDFKIPATSIQSNYIYSCLTENTFSFPKENQKLYFVGNIISAESKIINKKGKIFENIIYEIASNQVFIPVVFEKKHQPFLELMFSQCKIGTEKENSIKELSSKYQTLYNENIENLFISKTFQKLIQEKILLII